MEKLENKIEKLIQEPLNNLGYSIYDIQYVKEAKNYYLRILIEKPNGTISLNDCEKANNSIIDILDKSNLIKEQYFLEISSTGVERVIRTDRHLERHINNIINIKLFKPINGKKEYIGTLLEFDDNNIKIELKEQENIQLVIDRKDISIIKKYYEW